MSDPTAGWKEQVLGREYLDPRKLIAGLNDVLGVGKYRLSTQGDFYIIKTPTALNEIQTRSLQKLKDASRTLHNPSLAPAGQAGPQRRRNGVAGQRSSPEPSKAGTAGQDVGLDKRLPKRSGTVATTATTASRRTPFAAKAAFKKLGISMVAMMRLHGPRQTTTEEKPSTSPKSRKQPVEKPGPPPRNASPPRKSRDS